MIRTALKPAWLALLALLVVVVVSFYELGMWQLGVSSNSASREFAQEQESRPTVPIGEVVSPRSTFPADGAGRSVEVEGSYDATLQFLVPDRLLDGRSGSWVVTPVRTETGSGPALLPVVRGFVTSPQDAGTPGAGAVTLTGTLAPSESPGPTGLPEGQRGSIDTADLANDWDAPIYDAFIFLVDEEPTLTDGSVQRVPPPVFGENGVVWRNVGYGLQWFVFAGFAIYMYFRFLHDAARREAADGPPPTLPPPTTRPSAPSEETRR
ncbi:Cytochrome oxidase biogenesis protein Surf1, facilitates heme A insertion [Serinicoccus hydrothermalis]|uniref:SURF1-like protein n=1 Tax=Serinicoccus hydrothermalis TaxID=1758689 RepID=A0A1B1NG91_9MICO|nr:SURF1 family protein [Serinicoccus hydrothermalis]ANS80458.1 Cytochrome oxidase biogenesis protein Surf1, facilitates heme A insertion [Serinicoccus hydrothermalis]